MKRFSIILTFIIILQLVGCGNKTNGESENLDNVTVRIIYNEDEHIIKNENGNLKYYVNNKLTNNIDKSYNHDLMLELPNTNDSSDLMQLSKITAIERP